MNMMAWLMLWVFASIVACSGLVLFFFFRTLLSPRRLMAWLRAPARGRWDEDRRTNRLRWEGWEDPTTHSVLFSDLPGNLYHFPTNDD